MAPHEDGDAIREAAREALAQHLALQHFTRVGMAPLFDWSRFANQQRQSYRDEATNIMAGPLAQAFIALATAAAERDEALREAARQKQVREAWVAVSHENAKAADGSAAALATAHADIARLREALEPFDRACDELAEGADDGDDLWGSPAGTVLSAADLLRARAALRHQEKPHG